MSATFPWREAAHRVLPYSFLLVNVTMPPHSLKNSLLISVAAEARLFFLATACISSCTSQSSLHLLPPVLPTMKKKMIGYRIKTLTEDVVIRGWKDNCMEISLNLFFQRSVTFLKKRKKVPNC